MVSEDSDQILPGLLAIHRLSDFCSVRKALVGLVDTSVDHLDTTDELLKIPLLRRMHGMRLEERDDRFDQILPPTHHIAIQALLVVVVPPIRDHATHFEEVHELVKT